MHRSSWCTAIFMIGFGVLFAILYLTVNSYLKEMTYHHLACLASLLTIGIAIMMYRLLRGICTRQVKYYHFLLNVIGAGLIGVSYFFVGNSEEPGKLIHRTPSFILMFGIIGQILGAAFVFVYMGGTQSRKFRTYFAPFHDIIGLWIYLSLVVIYLVAINRDVRSAIDTDTPKTTMVWINTICLGTFLLPIFVVLCPYMEWELVGPI